MAIIAKSYSKNGTEYVAPNLQVHEFASISGGKLYSDTVLYDTVTVGHLVELRRRLDALGYDCTATVITSGYRTSAHEKVVGNASGTGPHVRGEAVDFYIRCNAGAYTVIVDGKRCVDNRFLCCILQDMGVLGIECIKSERAVHVDSRTTKWFAYQVSTSSYPTVADFFDYYKIPRAAVVPPPPPPQLGDVNGDGKVDSSDARMVLQQEVGALQLTSEQMERADVDGDGVVDSTDARMILQKEVGLR